MPVRKDALRGILEEGEPLDSAGQRGRVRPMEDQRLSKFRAEGIEFTPPWCGNGFWIAYRGNTVLGVRRGLSALLDWLEFVDGATCSSSVTAEAE